MDTCILQTAPAHQLRDCRPNPTRLWKAFVIGDPQTYGKGTFQTFTLESANYGKVNPKGNIKSPEADITQFPEKALNLPA